MLRRHHPNQTAPDPLQGGFLQGAPKEAVPLSGGDGFSRPFMRRRFALREAAVNMDVRRPIEDQLPPDVCVAIASRENLLPCRHMETVPCCIRAHCHRLRDRPGFEVPHRPGRPSWRNPIHETVGQLSMTVVGIRGNPVAGAVSGMAPVWMTSRIGQSSAGGREIVLSFTSDHGNNCRPGTPWPIMKMSWARSRSGLCHHVPLPEVEEDRGDASPL